MTSKMLQAFCMSWFSALASYSVVFVNANYQSVVHISMKTLKSDLDLILEDPVSPPTINIEYADGAVLSMSALLKPGSQRLYIDIDGTLDVKLPNGHILKRQKVEYRDGSFGLPNNYDNTAYIIIKPDTRKIMKRAHHTIRYISMKHFTEDLREEFKDLQKSMYYTNTMFEWQSFRIGSRTTEMTLIPEDGRALFKKPLKGISLHGENFNDDRCCGIFKIISLDDQGSSGTCSQQSIKQFDILFDVWYDPKSKLYGSSSGSMGWVDAVRIYDEWSLDVSKEKDTQIEVNRRRGDDIRKKIFDHDMRTAFQHLHGQGQTYENVLIDYANEITLDVRPGDDGGHRYITATGSRKTDTTGEKIKNVKAYYDLKKLEYSDQIETEEEFVPENYEEKSFLLRYIDWDTFVSHLEGMWTALQGGCKEDKTRAYAFSLYGGNIRAKYDCLSKTLALTDTILALTDIKILPKPTIKRLENVSYREVFGLELPSLPSDMTPIAIQVQHRRLPFQCCGQVNTNAEVFNDELKLLNTVLIRNGKSRNPTLGTIILNDKMLFEIKLPEEEKTPTYVKIDGNFALKSEPETISHETLNFNEGGFSTSSGVPVKDVFITRRYKSFNHRSLPQYIIGSKYLTIKGLTFYLRTVLDKAMKRCISRQVKTLSFKLVLHRKFALSGFCDCSQSVMLVEGTFRALLLTRVDGNPEVHSNWFIHDFIYMKKGHFLIPGSGTLDGVYAISVPEMANWVTARRSFGGPIPVDKDSFLVFKSED